MAEVSCSRVAASLVRFELSRVGERLAALFVHCTGLNMGTAECLLVQVNGLDVTLQSLLLPELFPTILTASLFLLFVHGDVSTQPCCGVEPFAALLFLSALDIVYLVCADIAALVIMLGLDVGFQVFVTKKALVASFFGTRVGTFIGMRANMHLQTNRTVEGFAAFFVSAHIILRSLGAGCRRDRGFGDRLGSFGDSG